MSQISHGAVRERKGGDGFSRRWLVAIIPLEATNVDPK
jgi:hypothetical protein